MHLGKWLFRQKRSKAQMISYYKQVFETSYAGRYVLADLCRHGMIDQNTFDPTSARNSDFNEGRRAMALHILNTLDLNPNEFTGRYHLEGSVQSEEDY